MPQWLQRKILLPLLFMGVAVLMVQCSTESPPVQHANGLTCQTHNNAANGGLTTAKETDCRFKCPDGRLLSLPEAVVSQSKDQLNFLFCGVALPDNSPASSQSSAAAYPPSTTPVPLLNQQVDICDPVKGLINFVLAKPPQDLTGQKLIVQIQGQQTPCSISLAFPGELSCKLPPNTSFPTGIIVRVNDQVVNIFPYSGGDCEGRPALHDVLQQPAGSVPPPPAPQPPPGEGHGPHPGGHGPHPPHPPKPQGGPKGLLLTLPI